MSGGGGSVKQTTEPWSGAKPYYPDLYKAAQGAFANQKPPPDKIYAPQNQTQTDALTDIQGIAPKYGDLGQTMQAAGQQQRTGSEPLRTLGTDTISGKYMDPASNPFLSKAVEAAQHDTFRNFWEQTNPAITSGALMNGTYGGDRTNLVTSRAMEGAMSDAMRQANQIYYGNYDAERNRQMDSGKLFAGANALDNQGLQTILGGLGTEMQNPQIMGQTGDQLQGWDQAALDAELQKWNIDTNAAWDPISRFASILGGGGFNSQAQTQPGGRGASIFQGAVGGAGTGYQLGQQSGMDPNMMALILSALGGASGY